MSFLGMGPLELLLIVVLALIVFGPAKLPEIMGQVGKAIADFRRATSELSDEFNRTIQTEINQTRRTIEEPIKETRATLEDPLKETRAALNEATSPAPVSTAPPAPAPSEGLAATVGATAGSAAASSPPLADTSQWTWETSPSTEATAKTPPEPARDELLPPY
jgi:sec-independent protein translocase protein TatB